ncbi:MAG: hypothetical protein ACFFAN_04195 [Promethearchaeota archaeon]
MSFIDKRTSYPSKDPYFWFKMTWFVHENGYLVKDYPLERYAPGYILFCTTITSFIDDYYVFYYFLKYLPFFLMSINVLVIFIIAKRIFIKKVNIFFVLVILLSFSYLNSRYNMPISSNLATTLCFLFLLFLNESIISNIESNTYNLKLFTKRKLTDKNSLFKGLVLAGIFMANPIYLFFYSFFFFFFELYLLLRNLNLKCKFSKENLSLVIRFFISFFSILLYFFLFLIPYIIGTPIYLGANFGIVFNSYSFLTLMFDFQKTSFIYNKKVFLLFFIENLQDFIRDFGRFLLKRPIHKEIDDFFRNFLFEIPIVNNFRNLYTSTLGLGIFFIIFGLFIKFGKYFDFDNKQKYLICFIKFSFLFIILYLAFYSILVLIEIPKTEKIIVYSSMYKKRMIEIFSGFWAVIFVLSINFIFKLMKKIFFKIKKPSKTPNKRMIKIFKMSQIISLILLSGFFYVTNFRRTSYTMHQDNKERFQAVLFVGNYFNEHPLDKKTKILLEDLGEDNIFNLLTYKYLKKEYYDFTEEINYTEFFDEFDQNDYEYILLPEYKLDDNFIGNFSKDFEDIYENSKFIFAKID